MPDIPTNPNSPATTTDDPHQQYGHRRTRVEIEGYRGFVLHPSRHTAPGSEPGSARPWVWYAPTIGQHPNRNNAWLLRGVLERGFHVAGIDIGESCGNPAGREAFTRFHLHLVTHLGLDPRPRLLAQSRGGLMLYNWAAEHPELVRGVVGIYPVCDLRSYPGLEQAAPAYGMSAAELAHELHRHNPIDRLAPLAAAGIPILHIHGDADELVPLEPNSGTLLKRYHALGGGMDLITVPGKGHAEIPEIFQHPRLLEFLLRGGHAAPAADRSTT